MKSVIVTVNYEGDVMSILAVALRMLRRATDCDSITSVQIEAGKQTRTFAAVELPNLTAEDLRAIIEPVVVGETNGQPDPLGDDAL